MRDIDEDTITQAVIARHALAGELRTRELMTSLVQHLHAFARDVRLTEDEWTAGLRFLTECSGTRRPGRPEVALLSDALGLSRLVMALRARGAAGGTEPALPALRAPAAASDEASAATGEPCFVFGYVRSVNGSPVAGATVRAGGAATESGVDGAFRLRTAIANLPACADGPVARLLRVLGRETQRPEHLDIEIVASGHEPLRTELFRRDDPRLDADALFGVRSSLLADWVRHGSGPMPDGQFCKLSFTTVEFDFVLTPTTGDKR